MRRRRRRHSKTKMQKTNHTRSLPTGITHGQPSTAMQPVPWFELPLVSTPRSMRRQSKLQTLQQQQQQGQQQQRQPHQVQQARDAFARRSGDVVQDENARRQARRATADAGELGVSAKYGDMGFTNSMTRIMGPAKTTKAVSGGGSPTRASTAHRNSRSTPTLTVDAGMAAGTAAPYDRTSRWQSTGAGAWCWHRGGRAVV